MQQVRSGIFKRIWVALAGEQDPVKAQLKEMSRQGAGMARVGNACALLLVILFSLISFSALARDDFETFLASWQRHQLNVLAGIFTLIVPAMVLAMDFGMLYAASMIRRLKSRHSGMDEKLIHYLVLWGVVVLEAGTYIYAAAIYEHPHSMVAWSLIVARACGAPLLSVYLSMAQAIPVSPRDILYQAELIAGVGILRRVTVLANDSDARLSDLLSMYRAASVASVEDHKRLGDLVDVSSKTDSLALPEVKAIPPKLPPSNGGQHVDISPILNEVGDDDTDGYTQPDLRIARFSSGAGTHNNHRNEGLRRHRNYDNLHDNAFEVLDSYGLDDRGRPALSLEELQGQLRIKRKYAMDFRNEWWREQIASMHGQDISVPDLAGSEIEESGLWVAK